MRRDEATTTCPFLSPFLPVPAPPFPRHVAPPFDSSKLLEYGCTSSGVEYDEVDDNGGAIGEAAVQIPKVSSRRTQGRKGTPFCVQPIFPRLHRGMMESPEAVVHNGVCNSINGVGGSTPHKQ
ncbi:unnamed protein product [Bursaphelenchus xylophilus]|uniref:(pine wood nematode) hypothetical protein n=1 Tax=Bursaphelenchus xylophilus TaxID=6326 RepID=A0A811KLS4_BURXY|nr:unnamed protein product [Bursaphelenchus xylophilus]CAG9099567.1 unnamed protein product [Bursaphelenchus xylophilus]